VRSLYDHAVNRSDVAALAGAKAALDDAAAVVAARQPQYRAPHMSEWGRNPTAYHFAYLWPVSRLYYWWRDFYMAQGPAAVPAVASICFLNIQDPVESQCGRRPLLENLTHAAHDWLQQHGLSGVADCLQHPATEPRFPLNASWLS